MTTDTLLGLPRSVWFSGLFMLAITAVAWMGKWPAKEEKGWHILTLTPLLWVMAIFTSLIIPALVAFFVLSIAQPPHDWHDVVILAATPAMTAVFAYSAVYLLVIRIRFNNEIIERHFFGHTTKIAWDDVLRIKRHFFFGPQIFARNGNKIVVWEYLRGFRDLIRAAAQKGIVVDL
jgi:hypothetical protein